MSFIDLNNIEAKGIFPGIYAKFIHSENMSLAFITIDEGIEAPEHAHEHEQVLNLIEGEFELIVNGEKTVLKQGNSFVLKSNVPHSGKALKLCKIIDVFNPVREDFKKL